MYAMSLFSDFRGVVAANFDVTEQGGSRGMSRVRNGVQQIRGTVAPAIDDHRERHNDPLNTLGLSGNKYTYGRWEDTAAERITPKLGVVHWQKKRLPAAFGVVES